MATQITRKANRLASVCRMRCLSRSCELVAANGCGLGTASTLTSSFETEVVIPNRTKNRTNQRLFIAAINTHDPECDSFRFARRLERQVQTVPRKIGRASCRE